MGATSNIVVMTAALALAACGTDDVSGTDSGSGARHDAGGDAAPPADADDVDSGPADAGAMTCVGDLVTRTVGAHRSALPALAWNGAGFGIVIDEVVSEQPFVLALTMEKTDETGARIAGPT